MIKVANYTESTSIWDGSYERKAVTLLSLGSGLVGIDRFMLLPMFPLIMRDMHLGYGELGLITGCLGYAYGLSALLTGLASDRVGRRGLIVGSVLLFSLMIGLTGLAGSLATLCLIRAVMGLADGAYMTPAIVETMAASRPDRRGRNLGLQLMMNSFCGLALCPILVTQLLHFMEWRWIFLAVAPVGLCLTFALYAVLRDGRPRHARALAEASRSWYDALTLIRHRNVWLGMVGMLCWLACLINLSALLPNYFIDVIHLPVGAMGFVLSAIGFGGTCGNLLLPALSDRLGRKAVALLCAAGGILSTAAMMAVPPVAIWLFLALFMINVFVFALITLTVGPIATESVPVGLAASASGLIVCVGELLGGGMAPVLGGWVAARFGIEHVFDVALTALALGFCAFLFLIESAPARRSRVGEESNVAPAVPVGNSI